MEKAVLTLEDLQEFAKECAKKLKGGEIIALIGELGAGKTTFVQSLLKARGVKKTVTSPTFGIMSPYRSKGITFNHVDLYRINSMKEVIALGITHEWLRKENIFLIEWADKIQKHLPKGTVVIKFSKKGKGIKDQNSRLVSIKYIK